MLVVGLTGGIAAGKTTAAKLFEQKYHRPVIDTDHIAKQICMPGEKAYTALLQYFGKKYLLPNGQLDRVQLRQLIFSNPDAKLILENCLHPFIHQGVKEKLAEYEKQEQPYCIVVIPLLTEKHPIPYINRILLIDVSVQTQLRRLMQRDKLSRTEACQIIQQQSSRSARLLLADDIIFGEYTHLEKQIFLLDGKYTRGTLKCNAIVSLAKGSWS